MPGSELEAFLKEVDPVLNRLRDACDVVADERDLLVDPSGDVQRFADALAELDGELQAIVTALKRARFKIALRSIGGRNANRNP